MPRIHKTGEARKAFATRNPDEVLQREMRKRLVCLASFFHKLSNAQATSRNEGLRTVRHELIRYANAGDVYLNELYDQIQDEDQKLARVPLGIHYRIGLLTRILEKSVLLGLSTPTASAPRCLSADCRAVRSFANFTRSDLDPDSEDSNVFFATGNPIGIETVRRSATPDPRGKRRSLVRAAKLTRE